jgi:hypothetical protein
MDERTEFENWLSDWTGCAPEEIRENRAEFGYEVPRWDLAYSAWIASRERAADSASPASTVDGTK